MWLFVVRCVRHGLRAWVVLLVTCTSVCLQSWCSVLMQSQAVQGLRHLLCPPLPIHHCVVLPIATRQSWSAALCPLLVVFPCHCCWGPLFHICYCRCQLYPLTHICPTLPRIPVVAPVLTLPHRCLILPLLVSPFLIHSCPLATILPTILPLHST
jgi:hypothetical protein